MSALHHRAHPVYAGMRTTIFEEMSALARASGAINLGQGFPEDQGPSELVEAAARALRDRPHHYPPMAGVPELRAAVAAFYQKQKLRLTPDQVIVTSGATEALAATIFALVRPGDEVLIFTPAYDAYAPLVHRAGGVPVLVPLEPPQWRYDSAKIAHALSPATRLMIVNDPLNPTGTAMSAQERHLLASICVQRDLIAICDDVWEEVRFDGQVHSPLMAEPGMAERTVKIGSAGKIFGLTGWKIGWLCASPDLAAMVSRAHQFLTFTTPPALQYAVAEGLPQADVIARLQARWAHGRDLLNTGLAAAGFGVLPGTCTWFSCVDLSASDIPISGEEFARRSIAEAGVACIPVSAFDAEPSAGSIVRFCHCKPDALISKAVESLAAFGHRLRAQTSR